MRWWRGASAAQFVLWSWLGGCAQLLGADALDYTLGDASAGHAGGDSTGPGGTSGGADANSGGAGADANSGGTSGGAGAHTSAGGDAGRAGNHSAIGNGGAAGRAGNAGTPGSGDCKGNEGPTPVNIDDKFCIDSTEVTYAQYLEFVNVAPVIEQPAACSWNVTPEGAGDFEPDVVYPAWPPAEAILNLPVGGVDWCDARAYCDWAGKRLCGRVDGGPLKYTSYVTESELYYACSHNGDWTYPYGDTFELATCAAEPRQIPAPVKSLAGCESGFAGVYDLSGNVGEWQDTCLVDLGPADACRLGSFGFETMGDPSVELRCDADYSMSRRTHSNPIGIRCCSDVL